MRITIISQYFYPEEFKINDLAKEIAKRGHRVTVITGKPNYPSGNYAQGYSFKGVVDEEYEGVKVIRVPLIRRASGGAVRLVLNYFSFVYYANKLIRKRNIETDAVFCFEISPITQMLPALKLSKKNGCKSSMWVQDLWPESVVATGNARKESVMIKVLNRLVKKIYSDTDTLFISSRGFESSIASKGVDSRKIIYAPNWAEDLYLQLDKVDSEKYEDIIPNGFVIMFAGNLGAAQDLKKVLLAAEMTKEHPNIKWVIVGDGRMKEELHRMAVELGLKDTVSFLGRHPTVEMPNFFVHADVMLMSLRDEEIFRLTVPAKTQTYMAFGKPILSMVSGEANNIIMESNCGLVAESSDYVQLAKNAILMSELPKSKLDEMGRNAKVYYERHFSKKAIVDTILNNI